MKSWSTQIDTFKIKVFLDTNILCYLVDNTYPALTSFIDTLYKLPVVDLISSDFVLTEFIGVRKQEHYLRCALEYAKLQKITINFSSLIKNNKRFSIPGSDFTVLESKIKEAVKGDEETITTKFGIEFCCGFNKALLKPTSDICLSSKISKEDSLVLASSVHMNDEVIINNKVILFTNDGDFSSWFNESMSKIENVFESINARTPVIEHISRIGKNQINASDFNITDLQEASIDYIQAYILEEYDSLYLGTTTTRATSTDIKNLLCIKSKCGIKIPKSAYILILGEKLDFLYIHKTVADFWHCNTQIPDVGFTCKSGDDIVTSVLNIADYGIDSGDSIFNIISESGNYVFIHPDNNL